MIFDVHFVMYRITLSFNNSKLNVLDAPIIQYLNYRKLHRFKLIHVLSKSLEIFIVVICFHMSNISKKMHHRN
jgi:hypothetical protein